MVVSGEASGNWSMLAPPSLRLDVIRECGLLFGSPGNSSGISAATLLRFEVAV